MSSRLVSLRSKPDSSVAGKRALVAFPPATLGPRRIAAVGAALAGVVAVTLAGSGSVHAPGLGDVLVLLPAAVIDLWHAPPAMIGPGQAALVIYLGAGCSALTYALWGYALRHIEAGRAASADALIPVVVAGIWLAMSEPRPARRERLAGRTPVVQ